MTKQSARENDLIGTANYRKFLSEARRFFQRCVAYLRRISASTLKDDVIKSLTFTCVPICQKATLDELSILVTQFPNVIPQEDITQLDTEFVEYQCTSEIDLPSYLNENKTSNRIDFIWHEITKIIDQCTVQPKFKHLPKLMKFLLSVPLSNAYCESIFSTVKKICTDDRHSLGKHVKEGVLINQQLV